MFEPLRAYLDGERRRAGIDKKDVQKHTRTQMSGHWFGRSQWALPTADHYAALQRLFGPDYLTRPYEDLRREYEELWARFEDLRREYEDLRREYEDLRRPFNVSADVPYTDVWDLPTVKPYCGKHSCEKPVQLMEHIIRSSSRPGAVVLDSFAGSGATGEAAINLGRRFIGIEKDVEWVERSRERLTKVALDG